ncbi:lactosylceramide 4-alpha-galactosyltransferase-like isoform X2 [Contarinia nasturtii]|uniref:lactosylceramide 4-alpha-galactosyltransferase-like isoform X2 n=1 Tax=Contarinia nasturtii TaxID=265458 RepID=UPI0012D3D7B1|nr:lactosylceramide 4-alpha-galactosyltransferase-like isoform X2 [Contarinia nasturtii]
MQSRPEPDKAIFFISTSCAKNARVGFIPDEEPSLIVSTLKSYPNIHFRNLDLYNYSMGTLGEYWIKKDLIFSTSYHLAHLSDYLRFLTLFKFGGVYMDMDIIVRKTLDGFPPNFGGEEDPNSINCAILGLESKDAGHKISELVVRENTEHYKPYEWAYSGPGALSRVLSEICHCPKNRISQARPEFCWGFKIFPQSEFYAIHWSRPNDTVSTDKWTVDYTLEKIKHSTAVHMWNSRIHGSPILKSQRTVYKILAEKNCPRIYDASDTVF